MASKHHEAAVFAAMVKNAREAKGWTQEELADKAAMRVLTIRKIEEAAFNPRYKTIHRLCDTLDIVLDAPLSSY